MDNCFMANAVLHLGVYSNRAVECLTRKQGLVDEAAPGCGLRAISSHLQVLILSLYRLV